MPRCRHALLAAPLALLITAAAPPARAVEPAEAGREVHLDLSQGGGYTRPKVQSDACLVEALRRSTAAAGFDGRVEFNVEREGRLSTFAFDPPAPASVEAALRAALEGCPWSPGIAPDGREVVVRVTQPLRVKRAVPEEGATAGRSRQSDGRAREPGIPPPPVVVGGGSVRLDGDQAAGFRRPVLDDPACLSLALQGQKAAAGLENKVKFAVMRDGSLTHFSFLNPVDPSVERAVVKAFASCSWKPAFDPRGTPLAVWVVQPVKVAPLPPPPEPQRALFQ